MNVYKIVWQYKRNDSDGPRTSFVVGDDLGSCEKKLSDKYDSLNDSIKIISAENLGEAVIAN